MEVQRAIQILRHGNLVAFPTETVYGLGADATNAKAIQKIFTAKGRPATNPLIVHVADETIAKRYVRHWPAVADQLAKQFWPGPLTLVLPKADAIVFAVTAGRATVGVRVPNHPLALELLRGFDGPIAAPSANRANHISPTSAEDVRAELGEAVDLILDGGACTVGIESTVLDLSTPIPRILRPGEVTREQIQSIIGPVELFEGSVTLAESASSPGQHARHYSPETPTFRFDRSQRKAMTKKLEAGEKMSVLVVGRCDWDEHHTLIVEMPDDPQVYAREIYKVLRRQDLLGHCSIQIEMPPDEPKWLAIRDRLGRAARGFESEP